MTTTPTPNQPPAAVPEALPNHEQICDLLQIGNPSDQECRLIRLGYGAATHAAAPAATQTEQPGAALTVEEAISALKIALRDSKGWAQSYSDALIRDAIERVPGADVPRMTPEEINALPEKARDYIHQLVANADPAGMVRENMQLRDTNEGLQRMYRKAADALAAAAPMSAQPSDVEALRHSANEWADMATNGLQWLRNVVDGISDPKEALANMERNLAHCRKVNDAPAVQAAIKSAVARQRAAFAAYLKDCDEHAIVPDVAGAFHAAWHASSISQMAAPSSAAPGGEAPAAPNARRYRLLVRGRDRIEAGDEFLRADGVTWAIDSGGVFVGMVYGGDALLPARRPLVAAQSQKGAA